MKQEISPKFMGWDASFADRADSGNLNVGIISLGYVGLPTAIGFRDAGFNVWGVDLSERIVNALHEGKNLSEDPDLDDMIPTQDATVGTSHEVPQEATAECDVLIVTVPTPVSPDLKPDLSYVESARDGRSLRLQGTGIVKWSFSKVPFIRA